MVKTSDDFFGYLDSLAIETVTIKHQPLYTVAQSQSLRGKIAGGHSKNLFLKCKKGKLFLVVCLEDAAIDLKHLHKLLGCGRLSFGKPDLLAAKLGVIPGAVTPFAVLNDQDHQVEVVLQRELIQWQHLNFHPLDNSATTTITSADLLKFLRATGHEPRILTFEGYQL